MRYTSGAYVEEPQRIEDDDFDDYIEAPALPNNYYEPLPHGYTNAPRPLARQRKRYTDGGAARQPREYYDPSTSVHTSQLPSPTKQRTTHARHASHAHYPADDLTLDHLDHLDTQEELVIQPYKSPTESRTRKRLVYPNPSFYPPTVSAPLESGFNAPPAAATITPAHPPQDDRREKYTADPSDLAYPPAAGGRKKTSQLAGKSAKQISIDRMDEWLAREEKAALKKSRPGTRPARKASVDEDPGYGEVRSGRGDRQFLVTGIGTFREINPPLFHAFFPWAEYSEQRTWSAMRTSPSTGWTARIGGRAGVRSWCGIARASGCSRGGLLRGPRRRLR